MEKPKRLGRPEGRVYSKPVHLRLTQDHTQALDYLAHRWATTPSEVLRRALLEAARREGLK